MGPVQPATPRRRLLRRRIPRSRVPLVRRLAHDPALLRRWLIVALLAWALGALVNAAVGRAEQAQERWGRTTGVWVVADARRAGEPLEGALRRTRLPVSVVPSAAVRSVPAGARAAAALDVGTVVTGSLVDRPGPRRRTVAVPLPDGHLPVRPGDRVDVWATTDPTTAEAGRGATRRVATGAHVAAAGDRRVVLEVRDDQVAALNEAAATAVVALAGEP